MKVRSSGSLVELMPWKCRLNAKKINKRAKSMDAIVGASRDQKDRQGCATALPASQESKTMCDTAKEQC